MEVVKKLGMRPTPTDNLQERYGWPVGLSTSRQNDENVIMWMKKVTLLIWNVRYDNEEKYQSTEQATEGRKRRRLAQASEDRRRFDEAAATAWLEETATEDEEDEDPQAAEEDDDEDEEC